ncbi:MAG: GNAT family N-acetyltransferase, partial [Nannocystaceae bacterium]|nr:GNAT family N-acetyltransferase [Nannocystaceae bacterium]
MGIGLRPGLPGDYPYFQRWFPMLESGDPTPSSQRWGDELVPACTVAELDGQPVGYCFAQVFGTDGYIRHVVVEPAARRSGAGRCLLLRAAASMREVGCSSWRLNVRDDNAPALSLYASLGLEPHHVCTSLRFPPALVDTLPCRPRPHDVLEPDAHQVGVLEEHFELPVGQLDSVRKHPAGVVLAVLAGGLASYGVATFDTARQGSFPFRAESVETASTLLHALRARATGPEMGVVSEDVDVFTLRLIEAGARVPFR